MAAKLGAFILWILLRVFVNFIETTSFEHKPQIQLQRCIEFESHRSINVITTILFYWSERLITEVQITSTLNLLTTTLIIRVVSMFVILDLQTITNNILWTILLITVLGTFRLLSCPPQRLIYFIVSFKNVLVVRTSQGTCYLSATKTRIYLRTKFQGSSSSGSSVIANKTKN